MNDAASAARLSHGTLHHPECGMAFGANGGGFVQIIKSRLAIEAGVLAPEMGFCSRCEHKVF